MSLISLLANLQKNITMTFGFVLVFRIILVYQPVSFDLKKIEKGCSLMSKEKMCLSTKVLVNWNVLRNFLFLLYFQVFTQLKCCGFFLIFSLTSDKKEKEKILSVKMCRNSEITNKFHLSCQFTVLDVLEHFHENAYELSSGSLGETARILCPPRVTKEEVL